MSALDVTLGLHLLIIHYNLVSWYNDVLFLWLNGLEFMALVALIKILFTSVWYPV